MINPFLDVMSSIQSSDWIVIGTIISKTAQQLDITVLETLKAGPYGSIAVGQTISIETNGINTGTIEGTDIFCFSDEPDHRLTVDASALSAPEVERILADAWGKRPAPTRDQVRELTWEPTDLWRS